MTVYVFRGPSITADEVTAILPGAEVRAPIRHGDVLALGCRAGDTVVIIDGVFHATAPVRHKEILRVLSEGVAVVGASSMGALRAAELHPFGMRGVGRIFAMYRDGVIEGDDEVAIAHTPDDFRALSLPLVNLRAVFAAAADAGAITSAEADSLVAAARSLYYTDRTWAALRTILADTASGRALAAVTEWRAGHAEPIDLKHADALAALRLVADQEVVPADTGGWTAGPWHAGCTDQWVSRFRARPGADPAVPLLAELHHQRLYDADFPRRRRRAVLARIAGDPPGSDPAGVERRAVAAVAERGLTAGALTERQLHYWLTLRERHDLDPAEQLLRVLTRSGRLDPADPGRDGSSSPAGSLLDPEVDSAEAVRAARRANAAVAAGAPGRVVHRLRADVVRDHLVTVWRTAEADRPTLDAAARDRGFRDIGGAIRVARAFYLHASGAATAARGGALQRRS